MNDQAVKELLASCIKKALPAAIRWRNEAALNEKFCHGDQFGSAVFQNNSLDILRDKWADDEGVPRMPVNRTTNLMLVWSSLLTKADPAGLAEPASEEPEDAYRAELANKFIEFFTAEEKLKSKIKQVAQYVCQHGTAGLKVVYLPEEDRIDVSVLTVFNYLIDPVADYSKAKWIIFTGHRDLEVAQDCFKAAGVLRKPKVSKYKSAGGEPLEGVETQELWHLPTKAFPKGLYACVMDGEVIETMNYPLVFETDGKPQYLLPAVLAKGRVLRDSSYGVAPLRGVIPLQRYLNELNGRMVKITRLTSNVHLLMPKELAEGFDPDADTILEFDKASPDAAREIKYLQPATVNPQLLQDRAYYEQGMADVLGLNSVTTGEDEKVRSGRAVDGIVELDAQKNSDASESLHDMVVAATRLILSTASKYYTTTRKIRISSGSSKDVISLDAADLDGVDVRLVVGAGVSQRTDEKVTAAQTALASGTGTQLQVDTASKAPSVGLSKQLSEKLIRDFLDGVAIDVNADDLNLDVFKGVIAKHKARAFAAGDRSDWASLHKLLKTVEDMVADDTQPAPAPEAPAPDTLPQGPPQ